MDVTLEAFWGGRCPAVAPEEWPFHAANPHRLPAAARRLYRLVTHLAQRFGCAFASAEYLAARLAGTGEKATWKARLGFHAAYVRKLLRRLVGCGLLERLPGGGSGRFRPRLPAAALTAAGSGGGSSGGVGSVSGGGAGSSGSARLRGARTEARPEARTEARPEARPEARTEARTEARPEKRTVRCAPRVGLSVLPAALQATYRRATALVDELGRRWSLDPGWSDTPEGDAAELALTAALDALEAWLTAYFGRPTAAPLSVIDPTG